MAVNSLGYRKWDGQLTPSWKRIDVIAQIRYSACMEQSLVETHAAFCLVAGRLVRDRIFPV